MNIQDGTCQWAVKDIKQDGKDIKLLNAEFQENKEGTENNTANLEALEAAIKKCVPITIDNSTLTPLMSSATGSGNITLLHPYTNYDALLIYHATDDQTYVYPQIISVSVFKHAIQFCKNNNKDRLNLSNTAGGGILGNKSQNIYDY